MKSDNNNTVWRRITVTALGAGAIAVGAMALGAPAAQATNIPAAQFKQQCINWPFEPGSIEHAEYKESRVGSDLHQICNIWEEVLQAAGAVGWGLQIKICMPGLRVLRLDRG